MSAVMQQPTHKIGDEFWGDWQFAPNLSQYGISREWTNEIPHKVRYKHRITELGVGVAGTDEKVALTDLVDEERVCYSSYYLCTRCLGGCDRCNFVGWFPA